MKAHRINGGIGVLSVGLIAGAYIFGHALVAKGGGKVTGLTSIIALQRPEASPSETASGTIRLRKTATTQEFFVDVRKIPATADTPVGGLGVYFSALPFGTNNFYFVKVLDGSTNGHWQLNLTTSSGAPSQLAVADVTDLVGRVVRIADTATNIYLETIIPPFTASPAAMSYKIRVNLDRPTNAPSPSATGQLTVKLDGVRGTSSIDLRTKKLAVGNNYIMWVHGTNPPPPVFPTTSNVVRQTVRFVGDTSKGQQLLDGTLSNQVVRVDQLSGATVEVIDAFGASHLQGIIP